MNTDNLIMSAMEQKAGVAAIVISLFLAAVDGTIISTVLPVIGIELGRPSLYPWIMSAFLLPVALVAPLAGALSDKFGVSATLKAFMLLFMIASILAAISPNMPGLIASRALQGIGAGGIIVLSYSFLAALFDAEKRGKMQGMLSSVWGLAAIAGPLLGSILADIFSWRAVFWFNIPIGIAALILLYITPSIDKTQNRTLIDVPAQFLLIALTLCLLLASRPEDMPNMVFALWFVILTALLLLIVRVRQHPDSTPVPLQFFQQKALFSIIVLVLMSSAGLYASVTLLPLALNQQEETILSGGLLIMLAALGWVIGSAFCGNRLAIFGYRKMAATGMLMLASGAFLMIAAIGNHSLTLIAIALLLIGLGMGFAATTTLVLAQNSAPVGKLGTWTATVQFLRNLGAALGVNTLAAIQLQLPGTYSFQICFTILGFSMLLGLGFALLLPRIYATQ